jgi:segregation and condensation protein B
MLKGKLEALLFSSGRKMSLEELSKLTRAEESEIQKALEELKSEHESSSLIVMNEGNAWKLTVREQFLPLVQKIVTETELSKTVMETLAVIAFKYPLRQSDLIKIRTNKAYDHLKDLEEMGYISRQKHGRTNLIKLTQKFFEYFDLPKEKLKGHFTDFESIAKAIEEKEKEIKTIKDEQKAKAEEERHSDEKIKQGIDSLDTYGKKEQIDKTQEKNQLGGLDVVEEPSESELEEERERLQEIKEKDRENLHNAKTKKEEKKHETPQAPEPEQQKGQAEHWAQEHEQQEEDSEQENAPDGEPVGRGIELTKEMEKMVDARVEEMLHPKKEDQDYAERKEKPDQEEKEEQAEKPEDEEEPRDLLEASMEENPEKDNQQKEKI